MNLSQNYYDVLLYLPLQCQNNCITKQNQQYFLNINMFCKEANNFFVKDDFSKVPFDYQEKLEIVLLSQNGVTNGIIKITRYKSETTMFQREAE